MHPRLAEMLDRVNVVAGDDRVRRADELESITREALAGRYDDEDRGAVLLVHALAEWNAGRREKAFAAIAATMVFCAKNRQMAVFHALRKVASLDDLRAILVHHCPADESVDDTLAMLSNLDALFR